MLEIYFDGVLLDSEKYMSLTQKGTLFDKTFKLGTTASREFKLRIPKADFNPNVNEVVIKYMSNDYAHLVIDKYTYNEGSGIPSVDITLVDKMVLANFNYDASAITPTTTLGILQDICNKIGVELGNTDFTNNDIQVDFYDNTVQARTYISYIAEVAGGFARIEADGKLYIRTFNNNNVGNSIIPELCEQIMLGQEHTIDRVVFDNGVNVFKSSQDETLETLYLNNENVYINTEEEFNKLCANILGFKYWNIDTGKTYVLPTSIAGDVLKFTYENKVYYTIEQYDNLNFMGSWQGSYKLQLDSPVQQETKVSGLNTQVKAIKIHLNRTDNILQIAVSDISTQQETSQELLEKIQANSTLITQTATEISNSVSTITGNLNKSIDDVSKDLEDATKELQGQLQTQQSLIKQLSDSITSTIKTTGGNNLLRNSVGFAGLDYWDATGNIETSQDSYTEQNTVSGSKFILTGVSNLKQSFNTQVGNTYGISFKIRHIINGTANSVYVRLHYNETEYKELLIDEQQTKAYSTFEEFNEFTFISNTLQPYIEIINNGDDVLEISDLIVSNGENQTWSGHVDEVYGKEHRLDGKGLILTDLASGNSTKVTNALVNITHNNEVVAELSKTQVMSDAGNFANKLQIRNLQMVALDDDNVVEYV